MRNFLKIPRISPKSSFIHKKRLKHLNDIKQKQEKKLLRKIKISCLIIY